MIGFQKVLRLSTAMGTLQFDETNNSCLMASRDRCYYQGKNDRTHLEKFFCYIYTMVQLSSCPGSGLVCSWASVLLLCSRVQLQDSAESSRRSEPEHDGTWKEGVYVQVQAWTSQSSSTNRVLHCTQGLGTPTSMLSSVFEEVVPIWQVFSLARGQKQK